MRSLVSRVWWYFAAKLKYRGQRPSFVWRETQNDSRKMFLERRFETRKQSTRSCQLGIMQAIDPTDAVFEEQVGVTVNQSSSGMQLLLGSAPQKGKLLEVHVDAKGLKPSFSLVEVRWSKLVRKTADGELYLVGCRLSFGPSTYWAF